VDQRGPSLKQRPDDIPLLIDTFAKRCSEAYKLPPVLIGDRALERLQSYAWPGNIRELENCIKYLTCLQLDRPVDPSDLPLLYFGDTNETLPIDELAEVGGGRIGREPLETTKTLNRRRAATR